MGKIVISVGEIGKDDTSTGEVADADEPVDPLVTMLKNMKQAKDAMEAGSLSSMDALNDDAVKLYEDDATLSQHADSSQRLASVSGMCGAASLAFVVLFA